MCFEALLPPTLSVPPSPVGPRHRPSQWLGWHPAAALLPRWARDPTPHKGLHFSYAPTRARRTDDRASSRESGCGAPTTGRTSWGGAPPITTARVSRQERSCWKPPVAGSIPLGDGESLGDVVQVLPLRVAGTGHTACALRAQGSARGGGATREVPPARYRTLWLVASCRTPSGMTRWTRSAGCLVSPTAGEFPHRP